LITDEDRVAGCRVYQIVSIMNDEDWGLQVGSNHRVAYVPYSNTKSQADGSMSYASVDVGYDLFRAVDHKFGAFIGYSHFLQKLSAHGCVQIANPQSDCSTPVPPTHTGILEDDTWDSVRLGVTGELMLASRLKLSVDAAWLPYTHFSGVDHHLNFNPVKVFPLSGDGDGVQIDGILTYSITDSFSLGAGGRYWAFKTNSATYQCLNCSGAGSISPVFPAKANAEEYGLLVQGSYKFGVTDTRLTADGSLKDGGYLPPISWTGFYAGLNGGGAFAASHADVTVATPANGNAAIPGVEPGGAFAGGQAGYNWQNAFNLGRHFVAGIETDIQGSDLRDDKRYLPSPAGVTSSRSSQAQVDYFGTVRGRLGYTFDKALIYATGGFAYGGVKYEVHNGNNVVIYTNDHNAETGYTIGGGLEYKINPNWSVKAEYQYISLGSFDLRDPVNPAAHAHDAGTDFHTARAGVNYQLDRAYEPLK
jgi:opacity protein-like surface antigen